MAVARERGIGPVAILTDDSGLADATSPPELLPPAPELEALLDASPDAVLIVDREGKVVALNRQVEALFGVAAARLRGQSVESLVPEAMRKAHAAARAAYAVAPSLRVLSARRGLKGLRADGTEFHVEISLTPVVGSGGGLVMAVVHDAEARAAAEAALLRGSDRAVGALDAIPDPIFTTDRDGRVDFLNRAAEELTGVTRESARGRPLSELLPAVGEADVEPITAAIGACLSRGTPGHSCEAELPAAAGHEACTLDLSTTPIRDAAGAISGVAVVARDVTHARRLARQLSHQATHDALTGLVNRDEFERRLARALASASGAQDAHAVCFLDLDGFKRVNDACGHLAGDELLRQLSDLMRERMRSRDTLARVGGDEFALLLEHCRLPRARRIADGLRRAIGDYRFTFGAETYAVGASIGIVPVRVGIARPVDVLRAADAACYLAKRSGGNRIQVSVLRRRAGTAAPPTDESSGCLVRAMEQHRFRLYLQPVLPLDRAGARPPRFELLIRLDEGERALLAPRAFLPAARREGLMPGLDRWIIHEAAGRLAEWGRAHPGREIPVVALNLDDDSVTAGGVAADVRAELGRTGLPARSLGFELNESVVAAHPAAAAALVQELRALGCRTTLEHGGSGMAAFTLLRRLHPDALKIAGHIIRGMGRDPLRRVLADAVNEAGHVLGLETIAAQVESADTLERVRVIGVDFAQGLAIAPPEPWDDVFARLD
jgi:diguanylate cyclase (GGDEF)-like protein/PAS domain S-box-containing protein